MKYTIIVVNYNKEKYLKKCLDSIINQTYKIFELIIIDDGSTDNSRKIINEYKIYNNVKIYFKKNTGVADTRNFGISKVKTKYFTFVDSDDYIELDLLENISKYKNYDILSFNNYKVYENGIKKIRKDDPCKGSFISTNGIETLIKYINNKNFFLVPWGYIYNINLFKNNNLKYQKNYVHEDILLTPILLFNSKKTITIDYYGYYYVQSHESITRNKDPKKVDLKIKSLLYTYKYLKTYFDKNINDTNIKKIIIGYFNLIIILHGNSLPYIKKKEYSKELKELKLNENIYIVDVYDKMIYLLCKKSLMSYYIFFKPLFILALIFYFPLCKLIWKIKLIYYKIKEIIITFFIKLYYFVLKVYHFIYNKIIKKIMRH